MSKTTPEEKNTVDFVTDAMFSVAFLESIQKEIFSPGKGTKPVKQFYEEWLKSTGTQEVKLPFSLGIFVGYMFCGLLITKENWIDLLPKTELTKLDPDWGLVGVPCTASKESSPSLRYYIRRLRNALGHTNFVASIPKVEDIAGDFDKVPKLTKWTFRDVEWKDPADIFETTLTMEQIMFLIRKFHSVVHQTVRQKV